MDEQQDLNTSTTVALLPWGNVIEDFLDTLGVSIEVFCKEFTGSWMFGYIDALQRAGVRTVLVCISSRIATTAKFTHEPTGATVYVLPALKSYRFLQHRMRKPFGPYARNVRQSFGPVRGVRRLLGPALVACKEAVLYLTTPPRLLAHVLRREGCTAVLCQEYEYPRFDVCVLIGGLLGLPVFASFQGGDHQRKKLERVTRRLAMRFCAGLIIGSEAEADRVKATYAVPPSKIRSIFNPVDPNIWFPGMQDSARARLGVPLSARVAVWHGRVSLRKKGLDILLKAWKRICAQNPNRDQLLILIGSGEDSQLLRGAIAESGVGQIRWVDQFFHDRSVIREWLTAGDVYVFPSRYEGFPVAPIEAMACGLPVAAAEARGVTEILAGGEASGGVIVPPEDPEALARAVERFLADPKWACLMGQRARVRVDRCFSPEAIGHQLRSFLWPAANNGGSQSSRALLALARHSGLPR
jgi:starch synthase